MPNMPVSLLGKVVICGERELGWKGFRMTRIGMTRALWGRLRLEQVIFYTGEKPGRYGSRRSGWGADKGPVHGSKAIVTLAGWLLNEWFFS
jgi:hypothetical protein